MRLNADLDWINRVDPDKVYDVLVNCAGAPNSESSRNHFISCWKHDWSEWRFGGSLGFGGKIWRERRYFTNEGYIPHLRVSCRSENDSTERTKVIEATSVELISILISAGLRKALVA